MSLIVAFPGMTANAELPTIDRVGGKAQALMRMLGQGFPVPPGVVLTAEFFAPWFELLTQTGCWRSLLQSSPDSWAIHCEALQALAREVAFSPAQLAALESLREALPSHDSAARFAVRSSAPDEDLKSSSFAGGYETQLGVASQDLQPAIRHCFASSLDRRLLVYKQQHGLDLFTPRIAVIVQTQINSEVSGVGFSLNPLNNDYDEAVFDANWGLGETVVAGLATPDHFVVDKVSRRVIEQTLGDKQVALWLDSDLGTRATTAHRSAEWTLNERQLDALTVLISRVETLFEQPIDIEWAWADGQLHLLQARPITRYVPLPAEMVTQPGQRRRLYADIGLSSGITINAPISPLGLDWMADGVRSISAYLLGDTPLTVSMEESFWFFAGGRMYQNLSNMIWLASPQRLAKSTRLSDALMAETFAAIDADRYRSPRRPPWARLKALRFAPLVLWRLRRVMGKFLTCLFTPVRAKQDYDRTIEAFEIAWTKDVNFDLPLESVRQTGFQQVAGGVFENSMPALAAYLFAQRLLDLLIGTRMVGDDGVSLTEKLKLGLPGNVVAEMGITLYRMAKLLPAAELGDVERLAERIQNRQVDATFLEAWDAFLATYGWRGPLEMDVARPRYADNPQQALRQMALMAVDDVAFDPAIAHQRQAVDRQRAYDELMQRLDWTRRKLLGWLYSVVTQFGGTRDTPKHLNLLLHYAIRQRALREGRQLVEAGRLDRAADVFDLTFDDLQSAAADSQLELRSIRERRTSFLQRLAAHVIDFPGVIDSRGRILRPHRPATADGTLIGMAVSAGVVTGPVKVLVSPDDKRVEKGDILVAYTTDPGWTPLFVNAAAVVLEVGGVLQHGAVVAREYGKPCVAGIDRVTSRLQDGQRVEVDGTNGVVRLLD